MVSFLLFQLLLLVAVAPLITFADNADSPNWKGECSGGAAVGIKVSGWFAERLQIDCKAGITIIDSRWRDSEYFADSEETADLNQDQSQNTEEDDSGESVDTKEPGVCPDGKVITGIGCRGFMCSRIVARCSKARNLEIGNCSWPEEKVLQGKGELHVDGEFEYISGIRCNRNCGRKELKTCVDISNQRPCQVPSDRLEIVTQCDARGAAVDLSCSYSRSVGASNSQSQSQGGSVSSSVSTSMSATLSAVFSVGLGTSTSTGYNWARATSNSFSESTSQSTSFTCPAGEICTLYQTVGVCGSYTIKTTEFRLVTGNVSPHGQTTPATRPPGGGGSMTWNGYNGTNCDFYSNNIRLETGLASSDECSQMCQDEPGCTNFAWNRFYKRCMLKTGLVARSDALLDSHLDCGVLVAKMASFVGSISWDGNDGSDCDFYGNDVRRVSEVSTAGACSERCSSETSCTHYSLDANRKLCLLKRGTIAKSDAQPFAGRFCGVVA